MTYYATRQRELQIRTNSRSVLVTVTRRQCMETGEPVVKQSMLRLLHQDFSIWRHSSGVTPKRAPNTRGVGKICRKNLRLLKEFCRSAAVTAAENGNIL